MPDIGPSPDARASETDFLAAFDAPASTVLSGERMAVSAAGNAQSFAPAVLTFIAKPGIIKQPNQIGLNKLVAGSSIAQIANHPGFTEELRAIAFQAGECGARISPRHTFSGKSKQ